MTTEWLVFVSPQYPQSNGLVERHEQTIKQLFKKARDEAGDEQMALGIPQSLVLTSHQHNCWLRASLPMTGKMLEPEVPENIRVKLDHQQQKQKRNYI